MSAKDNEQLIRKLYAAFEKNDINLILPFLAPDAEFTVIGMDQPMRGHQAILEGMKSWGASFPDMKGEIVNLIASDEWVVVEEINRGTHQGELKGPEGFSLPATNRKVEVPACDLFKIVNGKITVWKLYWQSDLMMKQLGYGVEKKLAA